MQQIVLLLVLLVVVNCTSLALFTIDKFQSKKRGWRIPESRLLLIAFFAPYGALAGMLIARHKTRKPKFLLSILAILILQTLLIIYFFYIQMLKSFFSNLF
jgi:uncharacterized membrane protein YsdA (DUF1294 family)